MKYNKYLAFLFSVTFLAIQSTTHAVEPLRKYNGFSWYPYFSNVVIAGYDQRSARASIPPRINGMPVAYIKDEAFANLSKITEVIIPNSVYYIGSGAFSNCTSLTYITIPDSIWSIDENAFSNCNLLGITASDDLIRWLGSNAAELGISFYNRSYDANNVSLLKTQYINFQLTPQLSFGNRPVKINGISTSKLPLLYRSSDTNVADFVRPNPNWRPGLTNIRTFDVMPLTNTNTGMVYYTNISVTKMSPYPLWDSIEIPTEMNFVLSYTNTNSGALYYSNTVFTNTSLVPFEKIGNNTWAVPRFILVESNMPVTFTNTNTGFVYQSNIVITNFAPITIAPTLFIKGAGTTTITAYQLGDGLKYDAASTFSRVLVVSKLKQEITFQNFNESIHYNSAPVQLNGYSSSGLPLSFYISDPQCTIATLSTNGNKTYLIPQGVGSVTIKAVQDGNENVSAAIPVVRKFRIIP